MADDERLVHAAHRLATAEALATDAEALREAHPAEPLRRQAQTSSILGVVCAVVVGTIGLIWHSPVFGLVVAVSMLISVNLSGLAGTLIPMLSKRLGFDPALTAGPFETALRMCSE